MVCAVEKISFNIQVSAEQIKFWQINEMSEKNVKKAAFPSAVYKNKSVQVTFTQIVEI